MDSLENLLNAIQWIQSQLRSSTKFSTSSLTSRKKDYQRRDQEVKRVHYYISSSYTGPNSANGNIIEDWRLL